jgi:tRNA(fMet)-specific endonuclease VapC
MFLFDTDSITNIFKKKPSKNLINKLSKSSFEEQFISTITIGEIVYGAMKSNKPEFHLNNLQNILLPVVNIVSFDTKSSFVYGEIRAMLEKFGNIISHTDLQIASIAIANNLTLITGNTRHFQRIEKLKIDNWL